MKRCPKCNDFALYDDNTTVCPICDSELTTYIRNSPNNKATSTTTSRNSATQNDRISHNDAPQFETTDGRDLVYRGIITEINHHSRFHNRFKKLVNSIFRGEPYQFGNTAHETVFRVEEFTDDQIAGKRRDLIFYGDVEGRFNYGDDVTVYAKRRGDRFIVKRMFLNETETRIKPSIQIPAPIIIIISIFILCLIISLVAALVSFIASGAFLVLFKSLFSTLITILIIVFIVRALFRRRR